MASPIPLAVPDLTGNEKKYVLEALESGWLTHHGRFEAAFERKVGDYLGHPALVTSSGTAALHIALLSLGVGPGDEVIIPALTFGATASAVLAVGAKPVIVDIDPETWGLSREALWKYCNVRTRAIIPVHLYGEDAGDYRELGIPVIEDACEAFGVVPVRGQMAAFSFYGNKFITTGEGGALVGDFGDARVWRDGGFDANYSMAVPGLNYRMTNLQAAVGLAQMERATGLITARLSNADCYARNLPGRGKWLFVTRSENPRALAAHLKADGIDTRPVFTPLHRCPAFRAYAKGKYKVADDVWAHGLCLPTGPHMSDDDMQRVIKKVKQKENVHNDIRGTANSGGRVVAPLGTH